MMPIAPRMSSSPSQSSGTLVPTEGRTLPLTRAHVEVLAAEGLARLVLRQRFDNPHDVPLEITYSLPLPAEAAVSGFAFTLGERRIVGEVDKRRKARERYEEALVMGHTAALVEQERDTLFTQTLGNVPPRTHVDAEIVVDLKLRYLAEGSFELRLPTTVAPRYLGEVGRVADAPVVAQDVAASRMPVRLTLDANIRGASGPVESTTHAIVCEEILGALAVRFRDEGGVALDRDVVLRWRATSEDVRICARVTRPRGAEHAYALLTVTPPRAVRETTPRDLVLLLDTSGSMGGMPLEQAKRVALALVETLEGTDTLEMISFSSSPARWKRGATRMDASAKRGALQWLSGLRDSGGTEMRDAIIEALRPLREGAQRQVVLVTDGLIGFETEIVREILDRLPKGSRVHTVGVGSGINRTLTAGAARAGRGIEVITDAAEDPERVGARLIARTHAPLVTDVKISGRPVRKIAPERVPDLFAGAPVLVAAEVDPSGGPIVVEGIMAGRPWRAEVSIPRCDEGEGLAAIEQLYAREVAADLEMRAAAGENVDEALERIGLAHEIATRLTSWLAISETKTVDENAPFKKERMPHELPYGTSAEGFGLRGGGAPVFAAAAFAPMSAAPMPGLGGPLGAAGGGGDPEADRSTGAPPPPAAYAPPPARARSLPGAPPRPAAPAPKKEKGGFISSLFRGRKPEPPREEGGFEDADEESLDERTMVAAEALVARIALRKDGTIVLRVVVSRETRWMAPTVATVMLADGTRLDAIVKAAPRDGKLEAGTEFRLVLELKVDDGRPIVEIGFDSGEVIPVL